MTDYQRPPVRVALIGLGRATFADHYPVYRDHPALFKVVAACDTLKDRRDIIEKDFPHCRMFRHFTDLLDERDIDLVDIATTSSSHAQIALASLKHGFWTLLESPMALSSDDAQILRGAAVKARNRLVVMSRGLFAPDYLLAKMMREDKRLGTLYEIIVRSEDYVRRDDWQAVRRLGGGAAFYAMPDLMQQTLALLGTPPIQMWSELKRLASLGDAEDYAHVELKTRLSVSADVEYNGGAIPGVREPSFVLRGDMGVFSVMPGASEGKLRAIDPTFRFPRRRSSVRTPGMEDMHEKVPVIETTVTLPKGTITGPSAFWKHLYDAVRTGKPFPISLEDSIEALKFSCLMKKMSPFGGEN